MYTHTHTHTNAHTYNCTLMDRSKNTISFPRGRRGRGRGEGGGMECEVGWDFSRDLVQASGACIMDSLIDCCRRLLPTFKLPLPCHITQRPRLSVMRQHSKNFPILFLVTLENRWEETLDRASRVLSKGVVEKLATQCCQ